MVWVVSADGPTGANGQLCAYNGVPANGTLHLLRCFPIGTAAKFSHAVGQRRPHLRRHPRRHAVRLRPAGHRRAVDPADELRRVSRSASPPRRRSSRPPTVRSRSPRSAPPRRSRVTAPKLPVTLTAGQTLTIPVTFAPTEPGSTTGVATLSVTDGTKPVTLGSALQGTAVQPGFSAQPATLDFGDVAVGSTKCADGRASPTPVPPTRRITGGHRTRRAVHRHGGLPDGRHVLAPGQTVGVSVTYRPGEDRCRHVVHHGDRAGRHRYGDADRHRATGHAQLTITPTSIAFGTVPVGSSTTKALTVANTGNLNVTITKAAPPATAVRREHADARRGRCSRPATASRCR